MLAKRLCGENCLEGHPEEPFWALEGEARTVVEQW